MYTRANSCVDMYRLNERSMNSWLTHEAIVKGEINLHKQLSFVWNKTRSVDTVR